jgi:molecular chaperone DnaK (HSP70)
MADFITCIKNDVLNTLREHPQGKPDAEVHHATWTITVPAGWGYKQQILMREAAVTAGLVPEKCSRRLHVITEPEAAAISCMSNGNLSLEKGSLFMVVDAGGATIDITVHKVLEERGLMEAVATRGRLAGSKLVDQEFEKWLCK